jgi:hypothetical protein
MMVIVDSCVIKKEHESDKEIHGNEIKMRLPYLSTKKTQNNTKTAVS